MADWAKCCRLLGQLSQVQQQLVQPAWLPSFSAGQAQGAKSLADHVDRLSICFVIATVQVEAAANLLQVSSCHFRCARPCRSAT